MRVAHHHGFHPYSRNRTAMGQCADGKDSLKQRTVDHPSQRSGDTPSAPSSSSPNYVQPLTPLLLSPPPASPASLATSSPPPPCSSFSRRARRPDPPAPAPAHAYSCFKDFLHQWQPPVEHFARRRRHPSLTHPSRRPGLPSLLEERETANGVFYLVHPDLALSQRLKSLRALHWGAASAASSPSAAAAAAAAALFRSGPAAAYYSPVSEPSRFSDGSDSDEAMEELEASDEDASDGGEESGSDSDSDSDSDLDADELVTPTGTPEQTSFLLKPILLKPVNRY